MTHRIHLGLPDSHRLHVEATACRDITPTPLAEAHAALSDDASWLRTVRAHHPALLRILVDADDLVDAGSEDLAVAHHLVMTSGTIHDVRVITATRSEGAMEALRSVEGKRRLPPLSRSTRELMAVLDAPDVDAAKVKRVLQKDPAMVAKTLQLANSPLFQRRRTISTLDRAIVLLGLANIRIAAMSSGFFRPIRGVPTDQLEAARDAGLLAVVAVRHLAGAHAEVAATAAMLLEVGKIVLMQHDGGYSELARDAARTGTPLPIAELQAYGTTHAEQGARLLHGWGLPLQVCEAIALSHTALPAPHEGHTPRTLTYTASELVDAVLQDRPPPPSLSHLFDGRVIQECHDHLSDQLLLPAA